MLVDASHADVLGLDEEVDMIQGPRRFPHGWFLTALMLSIALTAHCASETDTETYGTASSAEGSSSVASSSTGPMVNSPDKDAGEGGSMGVGCPGCELVDDNPKDCCEFTCVGGGCICGPRSVGSICDDGYGEGLCDSAQGCVRPDGGVSVCGCP